MHGESGHPRQNIVLVMASNSGGLSPPNSSCHPLGRRFAQSRIPISSVRRMAVVRWTGRGRRAARMRIKSATPITDQSIPAAMTAATATASNHLLVVIRGSCMSEIAL
jgi:hypothetical protein